MDRLANDLLTSVGPDDRVFHCDPFKTYLPLQARGHVSDLCGWRSPPAHDCDASGYRSSYSALSALSTSNTFAWHWSGLLHKTIARLQPRAYSVLQDPGLAAECATKLMTLEPDWLDYDWQPSLTRWPLREEPRGWLCTSKRPTVRCYVSALHIFAGAYTTGYAYSELRPGEAESLSGGKAGDETAPWLGNSEFTVRLYHIGHGGVEPGRAPHWSLVDLCLREIGLSWKQLCYWMPTSPEIDGD